MITLETDMTEQKSNDRKIDYVEFLTTDIEKTKKFFNVLFGWKFTDYGPDYTSFDDGQMLGGFRIADAVPAASPLIVIYSTDLETMLESVRSNGGTIAKEIFEFPGGRRFHFVEPGRNELAVWSDGV